MSTYMQVAIPAWKVFTFGGLSGVLSDSDRQGTLVGSAAILDVGAGGTTSGATGATGGAAPKWVVPRVEGRAPPPRADSCMAYDPKGSRLLVFGGWSHSWHGDMHTLDVGNIVGPPYAVTDISPKV